MGHGLLLPDTPVIDDLESLAPVLSREHWRVEAVTVRLHVLRMAVSGEWPGSLDDADAGLSDAVDRLRQDELARAVRTAACAARFGLDAETNLNGLLVTATPEVAQRLLEAADGLIHAVEAARSAADEVIADLERAAYEPSTGIPCTPLVSPTRVGQLVRLVERIIPPSIDRFLGVHVG
jgi:hypothetical protein